jgi:hypothetical protein
MPPVLEELPGLELARLRRAAASEARQQQLEASYRQARTRLGLTNLPVAADGDCFYHSIIRMFPEELSLIVNARPMTPTVLREILADAVLADFDAFNSGEDSDFAAFLIDTEQSDAQRRQAQARVVHDIRTPRVWDNNTGDAVVEIAARLWGLPATFLGRNYVRDFGPPGVPRRGYLINDGVHYIGAVSADRSVLSADEVRAMQKQPLSLETVSQQALATNLHTYIAALDALQTRAGTQLRRHRSSLSELRGEAFELIAQYVTAHADYLRQEDEGTLTQESVDRLGAIYARLNQVVVQLERAPSALPRRVAWSEALFRGPDDSGSGPLQ